MINLDFSKAFDSIPHRHLLHKLGLYGTLGLLLCWFSNYLTSRSQRVLLDGAFLGTSHFRCSSGQPVGSIPISFIRERLPQVHAPVWLSMLMRVVSRQEDCEALQNDLYCLFNWTTLWGLSFNVDICEVLRISRKRSSALPSLTVSLYVLGSHALPGVANQKDLGVTVTTTLSWSLHIFMIVAKAYRKLGFLRHHGSADIGPDRKKRLYLAFVRSNLEYASEFWAPQSSITDPMLLEGLQRRATRFILGCHPHHQLRPDYKSRLLALRLLPLSYYLEY